MFYFNKKQSNWFLLYSSLVFGFIKENNVDIGHKVAVLGLNGKSVDEFVHFYGMK